MVADKAYELGRAMAAVGLKALLGQETPAFVVAPALTVTKENVAAGLEGFAQPRARRSRCSTRPSDNHGSGSDPNAAAAAQHRKRVELTCAQQSESWLALATLFAVNAFAADGATTGPNGEKPTAAAASC